MPGDTPSPAGLKPTLRQLAILVLWAALTFAAIRFLIAREYFGRGAEQRCLEVALFIAVWPVPLMRGLLFLLDRPGPIRRWYVACCRPIWFLVAGIAFLLAGLASWALPGRMTGGGAFRVFTGMVCLRRFLKGCKRGRTAEFLCCARRVVIPFVSPLAQPNGPVEVGWCAGCGEGFEPRAMKSE